MSSGFVNGPNPMRNSLMRNAAINAQILEKEYQRDSTPVSDKERKRGYIAIGILSAFLIGIVALFFIL